jgi:1-acyl-sn-glycerol-3-phosphate acyltransferase
MQLRASAARASFLNFLTSLWIWFATGVLLALWCPLLLVRRLFDRSPVRRGTGRLFRQVGVLLTKLNPLWRVTVIGAESSSAHSLPCVVVANHQSLADIPVLSHLPWEMKWMAKKELFTLPIVGFQLKLAGDIPVDRENPRDAVKSLRKARSYLENQCSVMIFAEGSRSPDGEVGPFLDGAFRLAIDAGVPVLPIVVDGTANCLPKKSWRFGQASEVIVEVLPEVATATMTLADVGALREEVRGRIVARLAEMRALRAGNLSSVPDAARADDTTADEAVPA